MKDWLHTNTVEAGDDTNIDDKECTTISWCLILFFNQLFQNNHINLNFILPDKSVSWRSQHSLCLQKPKISVLLLREASQGSCKIKYFSHRHSKHWLETGLKGFVYFLMDQWRWVRRSTSMPFAFNSPMCEASVVPSPFLQ